MTSTEENTTVCVFPGTQQQPAIPFYEHYLKDKTKYLDWIKMNAESQLTAQNFKHPQSGQLTPMYNLNQLIFIAGQYTSVAVASTFISAETKRDIARNQQLETETNKVPLFGELVSSLNVKYRQQRWITVVDFFNCIFSRLRPDQRGYLSCLYRHHILNERIPPTSLLGKRKNDGCECGVAKSATFGIPGDEYARWCKKCPGRDPKAVDINRPMCECGKTHSPSYGLPGSNKKYWCFHCPQKPADAIKLTKAGCVCRKAIPTMGLPSDPKPQFCPNCPTLPEGAIRFYKKSCECGKSHFPSLALPGSKKGIWCAQCPNKATNAINVTNVRCKCQKAEARMGSPTDKSPTYCSQCPDLPADAVSFYRSRCHCGIRASYGLAEDRKAKWCGKHRPEAAVDLHGKKCECGRVQASFGLLGGKKQWCTDCKPTDAINFNGRKCSDCGVKSGNFSTPDAGIYWCGDCKPEEATRTSGWCIKCGIVSGSWGPKDGSLSKRAWCVRCKEGDAIIDLKTCAVPLCTSVVRYDDYCSGCFCHLFPEKPVAQNFRTKERMVIKEVKGFLETVDGIALFDKQIPNGSSKRRPDVFIDCKTHCIIIECDEFCHDTEEYCACEDKRIMVKSTISSDEKHSLKK